MKIIFHDNIYDVLSLFTAYLCLHYSENITFNRTLNLTMNNISKLQKPAGTLIYIGEDKYKNKIFILNQKNKEKIICQTIMGFSKIFNIHEKYTFFALNTHKNYYLHLARFIRKLHLSKLFVNQYTLKGIYKEFESITEDIKTLYEKINNQPGRKK